MGVPTELLVSARGTTCGSWLRSSRVTLATRHDESLAGRGLCPRSPESSGGLSYALLVRWEIRVEDARIDPEHAVAPGRRTATRLPSSLRVRQGRQTRGRCRATGSRPARSGRCSPLPLLGCSGAQHPIDCGSVLGFRIAFPGAPTTGTKPTAPPRRRHNKQAPWHLGHQRASDHVPWESNLSLRITLLSIVLVGIHCFRFPAPNHYTGRLPQMQATHPP